MMRYEAHGIIVVLAAFAISGLATSSQASEDGGTRSVFSEMTGGRGRGMGGAFAALSSDAGSVDWNPGGLAFARRKGALFLRSDYYSLEVSEEYAAFVWPNWRWGVGAVSVQHFGVDGIDGRDERNGVTNPSLTSAQSQMSLGYGREVRDGWGLGTTIRVQRYQIADASASAVALDVGTQLSPGTLLDWSGDVWQRTSVGLSVRNLIEPEIRLASDTTLDPETWRIGAAYLHPFSAGSHVVAALDLERARGLSTRVHAGLEVQVHPSVSLRTGYAQGHTTMGAGMNWKDVGFDYTLESNSVGDIHRVGMSYEFGKSSNESRRDFLSAQEAHIQERLEVAFERRQADRVGKLLKEAKASLGAGDAIATLQSLSVVETLEPENPDTKEMSIQAWMLRGQELEADELFSEAVLAYNRAFALRPDYKEAKAASVQAQKQSDKRARRSKKVRTLFSDALDAFSRRDLIASRKLLDEVLRIDPGDEDARSLRDRTRTAIRSEIEERVTQAEQFLRAGMTAEATTQVRQIQELNSANKEIIRLVHEISERRADRGEGGGTIPSARAGGLEQATTIRGENGVPTSANRVTTSRKTLTEQERKELDRLYRRGIEASQQQRSADAIRYFEIVYAGDPKFVGAADALKRECLVAGMDHFASNRLDAAIELWRRALAVDPSDEKVRGYLKRALQNRSRTEELLRSNR